jgi:hypothetical protein
MRGATLAAMVTSLHSRAGKTLLARALVDHFILSGGRPYIFDTDGVERRLHALFPRAAHIVDLAIVRDQMALFDTLANPSSEMRVVDVAHHSLTKFFELLRNTDFTLEAQSHDIVPVIFYIPDLKADSFEAGVVLRDSFPDCRFIVVENAVFKEPKHDVRQSPAYNALRAHKMRFVMPKLAETVVDALEDRNLSISDFMSEPRLSSAETPVSDDLSPDTSVELRGWALRMFQEIHRVTTALATNDRPPDHITRTPWVADLEDWGPPVDLSGPSNANRLLGKP